MDRARGILVYGSQMADPRRNPEYWAAWHDFEVAHGNEETFREMLRIKRSVQASFSTVNYNATDMGSSLENLDPETRAEMMELASRCTTILRKVYRTESFNMGINIGEAAGAGVLGHVHIHIVPRWAGDTNFMSTTGETRVLPEALEDTYQRVREGLKNIGE